MAILPRRLYRKREGKMVAGVAAGLADYFDVDPTLVRLVFVIAALINGIGIFVYIIMSFIVPELTSVTHDEEPMDEEATAMNETPRIEPGAPLQTSVTDTGEHRWRRREQRHTWAGLILIALGALFLAQNLGLLWWWNWRVFWPMVLICVGALLLTRQLRR
ncbi:MAG: PspC domain-containing protein [Chloroflexota bacterium]